MFILKIPNIKNKNLTLHAIVWNCLERLKVCVLVFASETWEDTELLVLLSATSFTVCKWSVAHVNMGAEVSGELCNKQM